MATPIRTQIRKDFESVRDPMIYLFLVRICLGIGFAYTLCDDFRVAFSVTCVLAVCALHTRRVFEEFPTECATHDVIKLLEYEFVTV